jgi:trans-2,3-dihydro-3-hydroxyanthranilate isomerase
MRSYVIVDVFTSVALEGNPVAVFSDGTGLSTETMQRAARELNLSETVFLVPGDEDTDARVRIFTPYHELPFAGHPVLGTAFVLGEQSGRDTVVLRTGSGPVTIALERRNGSIVFGEMHQPIPTWEPFDQADDLLAALGVAGSELPVDVYDNGPRHVFVALGDEIAVAKLRPDIAALTDLAAVGVSCFAVTDGRVKTRMFGPALGVLEDPATGSAAGPLAVHLARHGRTAFGETIVIRQGAEIGRPSVLHARADGSAAKIERVVVGGSAVVVARGEYRLDG